ncbi:copper ion binding protein [Psychrobacter sp. PL15]|jgi:copper ion binding protein|uniref:heavy-metal-associated domain-containing protein n=1 Tax=unclassified Psychrobacter TaxID=196806 RepID=UPI001AE6371E|nr:heavy-metal-associated domain-containing protein [Psychrobacter sp. PL15]MEC5209005.1 copper ion binding protein [Psychrobacter sp. PL15]
MAHQTRIIKIDGMTCAKCVESVHSVTGDIDGLISLTVELPTNQATVTFDDSLTSAEKIAAAIEDAGYETEVANS